MNLNVKLHHLHLANFILHLQIFNFIDWMSVAAFVVKFY